LYDITNQNLLDNPEKYQRFPFLGMEFITDYIKKRTTIINNNKNINQKSILEFSDIIIPKNKLLKENIITNQKLYEIYTKILDDNEFEDELNKFIKKFEIKRKIYEEYSNDMKTGIGSFYKLNNYLILSLCNLLAYEKKENLKYLNTVLKLNDVICSTLNLLNNNEESNQLLVYVLKKEIEYVNKLAMEKGVI
jgi:hypothetical protein